MMAYNYTQSRNPNSKYLEKSHQVSPCISQNLCFSFALVQVYHKYESKLSFNLSYTLYFWMLIFNVMTLFAPTNRGLVVI